MSAGGGAREFVENRGKVCAPQLKNKNPKTPLTPQPHTRAIVYVITISVVILLFYGRVEICKANLKGLVVGGPGRRINSL